MNILSFKVKKFKRKKENNPDFLYDFSISRAAKDAKEAADTTNLPDLPNLSALRGAITRRTDYETENLPDLIEIAIQREKNEEKSKKPSVYKTRFIQEKLERLRKYNKAHIKYDDSELKITDYYSIFENINNKNKESTNKRKKLKSKDLFKKYSYLKFQSWSFALIVVGVIWITVVLLGMVREYTYSFESVAVLAQNENIFTGLDTVEYDPNQDRNIVGRYNIRYINQLSEDLPNGCEAVSLAMVLSQFIPNINPHEIIDKYLPKKPIGLYNGVYIGEDPTYYYIGDPAGRGFGIFAEGITVTAEETLKAYNLDREREAINISGCSDEELFAYVESGYPVIVWGTLLMKPIQRGSHSWHLPTGQLYWYPGNQHCYILVEVSEDEVVLYDPREGTVTYDKSLFLTRWNEMGPYENVTRQAVVVR